VLLVAAVGLLPGVPEVYDEADGFEKDEQDDDDPDDDGCGSEVRRFP
jgi:hypothetical protein